MPEMANSIKLYAYKKCQRHVQSDRLCFFTIDFAVNCVNHRICISIPILTEFSKHMAYLPYSYKCSWKNQFVFENPSEMVAHIVLLKSLKLLLINIVLYCFELINARSYLNRSVYVAFCICVRSTHSPAYILIETKKPINPKMKFGQRIRMSANQKPTEGNDIIENSDVYKFV